MVAKHREPDLVGGARGGAARRLAVLHVPVDVLEHHDGVVDQHPPIDSDSAISVIVLSVKPKT